MSLFSELKRRNVFRVAIAYIVAGWLLLQLTEVLTELLALPDVAGRFVVLIVVIGFPLALLFAWAFELTPEGLKREREVDRSQSITAQTGRKLDYVIIGILAVAVLVLLADRFWLSEMGSEPFSGDRETADVSASGKRALTASRGNSVAVLPFINLSDDAANEYFSDGISEELLNVLVRIEGLRVPSRTSSFTFKGSDKKLSEIGRELQVDHVLEGSVRRAGDRIRVTAQLIDVHTDTHLWSETYTRRLDDIFAVQDEIARAIVEALEVTLTGEEREVLAEKPTDSVEAYNLYLQGRYLWNQRSRQSLAQAGEPLTEAVEIDPEFAEAWAALADAHALIPEYQAGPIDEHIARALEAAERALELDPRSARALTTRGYIKSLYEYDLSGAKADMERALELEPGYATAHQWYGEVLAIERDFDGALVQFRKAAELDPLAPIMWHVAGWVVSFAGDWEEALQYYRRSLEINPQFEPTLGNLAIVYAVLGNYDEARDYSRLYAEINGLDAEAEIAWIDAMEDPSNTPRALELLASPQFPDGVLNKAMYYMLLDEPDLAMDSLETAFAEGDPYAIHVNRMVMYDPLRDSPRLQAHLAKMNLWP